MKIHTHVYIYKCVYIYICSIRIKNTGCTHRELGTGLKHINKARIEENNIVTIRKTKHAKLGIEIYQITHSVTGFF